MGEQCMVARAILLVLWMLGAGAAQAATTDWWDPGWPLRQNLVISTGATVPDKGYTDYTVRFFPLDTATLIADGQLAADCADLRVLFWTGASWVDVPYDLRDCNSANSDLRFAMQSDPGASASDDNYYLYFSNPNASAPATPGPSDVYLWFDDASTNRIGTGSGAGRSGSSYLHGRTDPWHGTGWDDSATWNAGGWYAFNSGDNFTSGYRQAVAERDVLVEAAFFHTGCYPLNMTSGVAARIITTGSGGGQNSNHYIAGQRGDNSSCGAGYGGDGDVIQNQRTTTAIDGPNPGPIVTNQWRQQALAVFGAGTTSVRYWDADTGWSSTGWPSVTANVSSSYATTVTARGDAGVVIAQDQGRWRDLLVRRYVEPEPGVSANGGVEIQTPTLALTHSVDQPTRLPGERALWTVVVSNSGDGPATDVVFDHDIDEYLYLDLDPQADPGTVLDGSLAVRCVAGCPGSEGLDVATLAFSDDNGATFTYVPSSGAGGAPAGFDGNVTDIRITMTGRLAAGDSVTLEYRGEVR